MLKRVAPALRTHVFDHGYTIIELVIVMAIMAFLATAVFPLAEVTIQREREQELRRGLWQIREALDAYKRAYDQGLLMLPPGGSGYPPNLSVLVEGVPAASSGDVPRRVFLRRLPRDPFASVDLPADQTWGLRSYLSEAGQPRPGNDVYDVYSRSDRMGLNGTPLKSW